jgi:hypothetical protein
VIVLPMRTSEISRLITDTSQTLVPLAETMMSLEAGLALELLLSSRVVATNMNYPRPAPGRPKMYLLTLATRIFTSWNPLTRWLRQVERLRHAV